MGPETLAQVLCHLPKHSNENLLVGIETSDDAAVYKLDENRVLIQTIDFFTPVVDDPYVFGQIAATNSISDIYAMGGEPKLAMNVMCFPESLCAKTVEKIIKGGYNKIEEANALVVGGHTVEDDEPKYGLSVTGFAHPKDIMVNCSAEVGDVLILTKPLGLGIVNTAIKAELASDKSYEEAIHIMTTLNKYSKDIALKIGANSCTDVTGFGLLGHALEMAEGSGTTLVFNSNNIPYIKQAESLAGMGLVPKGAYSNKGFIGDAVKFDKSVPQEIRDIMFDPQTSGGLLLSVKKDKADLMIKELEQTPNRCAIIGEVKEEREQSIIVKL